MKIKEGRKPYNSHIKTHYWLNTRKKTTRFGLTLPSSGYKSINFQNKQISNQFVKPVNANLRSLERGKKERKNHHGKQ